MDQTPTQENPPTDNQIPQASPVSEPVPQFERGTATPKRKLPLKIIGIGAGIIVALIAVVFIAQLVLRQIVNPQNSKSNAPRAVSLTYWGLWEPSDVVKTTIKEFETQHPGLTITYAQQSPKDYRERLVSAFSRGQGPDIFRYHATWVPMLTAVDAVSTLPTGVMGVGEFEKTFYPHAVKDLKTSGGIVGMPLMTDGLALYINTKMLATTGKSAPSSWEELRTLAKDLTVVNADGKVERAGAALGSAKNIDHFSDVVGLLILQNGGDPANPSSDLVKDALKFYLQFLQSDKVWDETLPNSTYAFATEKVAMVFAPSWRAFEMKQINPNFEFETYPVPQLPGAPVTWSSYWAEGVSKTSKEQQLSWEFIKFLATKEQQQKLYTEASAHRLFGEPYSRTELGSSIVGDRYVGAYIKQAPTARSWYMASNTFDNGLNDQIITYYKDAINGMVSGKSVQEVSVALSKGVVSVLTGFKVPTAPVSGSQTMQ